MKNIKRLIITFGFILLLLYYGGIYVASGPGEIDIYMLTMPFLDLILIVAYDVIATNDFLKFKRRMFRYYLPLFFLSAANISAMHLDSKEDIYFVAVNALLLIFSMIYGNSKFLKETKNLSLEDQTNDTAKVWGSPK